MASNGDDPLLRIPHIINAEVFWRDNQKWLEQRGYMLRPRYRPEWIPSFTVDDDVYDYEDGAQIINPDVLDATHIATNELVMLKRISQQTHPYEVEITTYFTKESLRSDPRNHCVPLLEVLEVPNDPTIKIIVLPLLRKYNDPRFKTVGEALEFFRQAFEGLYFMHLCRVAHRDCGRQNIMMDPKPLFPKMYHPRYTNYSRDFKGVAKYYNRTSMPVQYYLIDFGLSRRYDPENISPREEPIIGGDKSVPEFKNWTEAMDPFPTDVYYIGNVIRVDFLRIYRNLEFMKPLIHDMVQDDPSKRPTMEEVVNRFSETYHNLPKSILRSRLAGRRESNHPILFIQRHVRHYIRTVIHILLGRNPMPTPS
ncbi:kinase-like domain-containing protein [Abortiporus biennis]|nr:kinase-like domain-containing protein [Abortiporus biennis]